MVLDQVFYEMAEHPEQIPQEIVEIAIARIESVQSHAIAARDVSEWAIEAVQTQVDSRIMRTRLTMQRAIEGLREAGAELARSTVPSMEEAEVLLRNVPRFAMENLPGAIRVSHGRWLGRRAVRMSVLKQLRSKFAALLQDEPHRYSQALRLWSEQTTRRLTALTNSYAEAYRAQLSRREAGLATTGRG